jgi:pimeloyl-ACP methyl ester carboxylesterase
MNSPAAALDALDLPVASDAGAFIQLSQGRTHYRIEGPPNGLPLVMLHGATVPLWEYDCLAPHLVAAGFRILRFDFYGHGLSDRLEVPYTLERFRQQALELIEATNFPRPAALMGHSVGAAIGSAVAAARPEWITRLVLVAPMLNFNATNLWSLAFRCPGLGEVLMRCVGLPALMRRRRLRYASIGQPQLAQRFRDQTNYAGLGRALLSMARSATLGDQSARYGALPALEREILVIWGCLDRVVPARHIARLRALVQVHRYLALDDARHNVLMTHPEAVAEAVREFTA